MVYYQCDLLKKGKMVEAIRDLNPSMQKQSDKAKEIFLKMFTLDIVKKGKILTLENKLQQKAFIVLDGKVMIYKKLYKMESNNCEARDKERAALN